MAYRHFDGAPFLKCWSNGTHICVEELDGRVSFYDCSLGFQTSPQVNLFDGPDAIWCLINAGVLYIGRNDSTFSGFREPEGLLVRYGAWNYPIHRKFDVIGQWGGYSAALDSDDHRTVYINDPSRSYILHHPLLLQEVFMPPAAGDASFSIPKLSIYTKEGMLDVKQAGAWVDAPKPTGGNCPLQL